MGIVSGCTPSSTDNSRLHYQKGKAALKFDLEQARQDFERAIREDPEFADAYLELAYLYEEKTLKDPAAAIFYFKRFLELEPDSDLREATIEPRIDSNMHELVDDGTLRLIVQEMENDMFALEQENEQLKSKLENLKGELKNAQDYIVKMTSPRTPQVNPAAPDNERARIPDSAGIGTYVVKDDDTFFAIARFHGISLARIQELNPNVDPRKLQPGQLILVPEL
jgi:tetratricopeptide (TPR) repeat protein